MSGMLLDWNAKPSSTVPPPASFYQDRRMVSFLHCLPYCCGWCCIPAFKISQPVVQQVCLFLSHVGNLRYTLRECVYTSPTVTDVCTTSPNSKFTSQMKQKPSVNGHFFIPLLCSQVAKRQALKCLCTLGELSALWFRLLSITPLACTKQQNGKREHPF